MQTDYQMMKDQIAGFAKADPYFIPLMANAAAVLFQTMEQINWAGFYIVREGRLVLGPFQGKPACIHIAKGKGVCGTAYAQDRTVRVADVHAFPGHIACDAASRSEIVIPLHAEGSVIAVLDIDSPIPDRFSEEDEAGLCAIVEILEAALIY